MSVRAAASAPRRRAALAIGLCALAFPPVDAGGQTDAGAAPLALPVPRGGYDFHDSATASPAQRLRDAPLPDPSTLPEPDTNLHDPSTGADTSAFGTAYTYPNPLDDTTSGGTVANSASKSAGLPQRGAGGLVLFEWGAPPPPMPRVPGEDLTAAPPPVARISFAVQADGAATLDAKSLWIVQRAVQAYGRAGLVEITIERPSQDPGCCAGYPDLVRAELIRSGLGPDPARLLSGHRIRLVLAAMPASR